MNADTLTLYKSQLMETINDLIRLYFAIDKAQQGRMSGREFFDLICQATQKAVDLDVDAEIDVIVEIVTKKPALVFELEDLIKSGARNAEIKRDLADLAGDHPDDFYRLYRLFNGVD